MATFSPPWEIVLPRALRLAVGPSSQIGRQGAPRVGLPLPSQEWDKPLRVVCKVEWHTGELFPRVGYIVINSTLSPWEVVKTYSGRGEVENRIRGGKNTLRRDKTSCYRFNANQVRLKMGVLVYNLLHMRREFYLKGEEVKRSMKWLTGRIIKATTRVAYHGRRWGVHVASAFPSAYHYRAALGTA